MKKVILIIISLLMLSNVVWAQKAPDGFWGLKWGSGKEELKKLLDPIITRNPEILSDLSRLHLGSITEYFDEKRQSDNINFRSGVKKGWEKIGEADVDHYFFYYHKNRLYRAEVGYRERLSFDIFLKALTMKYGNPHDAAPLVLRINPSAKMGMVYRWVLENKVEISLSYSDMESPQMTKSLFYVYFPILDEISKAKNKDAAKTKDKL